MNAIADSTVIFHLDKHYNKMVDIIESHGITNLFITRISYLELLAGASENAKINTRRTLNQFPVLEFDNTAISVANTLAMKYRVSSKNSKDFFIASVAIAYNLPLLTENDKDFPYKKLKLFSYRISGK